MTDYNDGKWHGWNGGECPVHPETQVDAILMDGSRPRGCGNSVAYDLDWDHGPCEEDIIAFRVVKEYREPLEVYLSEWIQYDILSGKPCAKSTWSECSPDTPGAVLFREVIE